MVSVEADPLGKQSGSLVTVVVGIPAFNEEKTIAKLIVQAQEYADVVVVCDDGSSDMTGKIAARLGAVVVRHDRNMGYGAALKSLFGQARELGADVLVTIDGDGQHDPSAIPNLVKPLLDGTFDVVLGSRFLDSSGTASMPKYRQLGVRVITKLINGKSKTQISDAQSGYRAYNKCALACLSLSETGMGASVELLMLIKKCGLAVCEVPITCKYADNGGVKTSTYNPLNHGVGLLMSIIKFVVEDRPLLILGVPGAAFLVVGAVFGVWLLNIYTVEHRIVTNIGLATLGFIFIGFFMVSTAITLYAITRLPKRGNANKQSSSVSNALFQV